MICVLKVDTQSAGWEKSITKVIKSIKDVSFTIDATHGIIRISGAIDPSKLLTEITKAGKHAELIAANVVGGSGGHSHNEYNGNHGREYRYNEYNGDQSRGYHYNEYNGGHGNVVPSYNRIQYQSDRYRSNDVFALPAPSGNVVPSYNHIQYQSDPYPSNGILALPPPSASEQLQHQQLQHYNDTNNNCVIM
ncbi:hypothetical protein MTR_7g109930 [Medicago truncatula]|uniref:HMA domain-containing protein n=1 Tax=Medicago truncatula TaxID=3880 RepID=G7KTP4_MEDTR|nr:hypothetical protein MTR_7g109930 [Medicago truncatula]